MYTDVIYLDTPMYLVSDAKKKIISFNDSKRKKCPTAIKRRSSSDAFLYKYINNILASNFVYS